MQTKQGIKKKPKLTNCWKIRFVQKMQQSDLILKVMPLLFLITFSAFANVLTIEDVILIPKSEHKKVVRMMHQYAMLQEAKFHPPQFQVKKSTYIESLNKMSNFFMQSAYAEGPLNFGDEGQREHLCLWAGWFSHYNDRSETCSHPGTLSTREGQRLLDDNGLNTREIYNQHSLERSGNQFIRLDPRVGSDTGEISYEGPSDQPCQSADRIICNPFLFGPHQPVEDRQDHQVYFCVEGVNRAINSTYVCAEGVRIYHENEGDDDPDIHTRIINNALKDESSRQQLSDYLVTMFESCLCHDEEIETQRSLQNPDYIQKIMMDRTCVGILRQSQRILDSINNSNNLSSCLAEINYSSGSPIINMQRWSIQAEDYINEYFEDFTDLFQGRVPFDLSSDSESDDYRRIRNELSQQIRDEGFCTFTPEPEPEEEPAEEPEVEEEVEVEDEDEDETVVPPVDLATGRVDDALDVARTAINDEDNEEEPAEEEPTEEPTEEEPEDTSLSLSISISEESDNAVNLRGETTPGSCPNHNIEWFITGVPAREEDEDSSSSSIHIQDPSESSESSDEVEAEDGFTSIGSGIGIDGINKLDVDRQVYAVATCDGRENARSNTITLRAIPPVHNPQFRQSQPTPTPRSLLNGFSGMGQQ